MPSLIYITRTRPLPVEIVEGLESAGFHVRSFGPGEITADECLLVMNSEAVLPGFEPSRLGTTRAEDVNELAASQVAIWNCIKGAAAHDSSGQLPASPGPRCSAPPKFEPQPADLGLIPNQAGLRALAASQQKSAGSAQAPPLPKKASPESGRRTGVSRSPLPRVGMAIRESGRRKEIHGADGQSYERYWQPVATAAALLIFAIALLASRATIFPAASIPRTSTLSSPPTSPLVILPETIKTPTPAAETRRHISDYDFVAEDYTTHFDLRAHRDANLSPPDPRHGAQNRLIPKRIVVN